MWGLLRGAQLSLAVAALAALLPHSLASAVPARGLDWGKKPKHFDLTLTWQNYSPNGQTRKMILVNGQFPAPVLEIDEGDDVEVVVHNKLPFNTTQHLTPWSDGVPGITQHPIQPGKSFNYAWTASQYGSYWYHAHQHGQLDDGLYGPIVIHPKKSRPAPFSLVSKDAKALAAIQKAAANPKPLMLSDYRHTVSDDTNAIQQASGIELTCLDSILLNGKGNVNCWSAQKIASLLGPDQLAFLQLANVSSFSVKGCLPPQVFAALTLPGQPKPNLAAIPADIFDQCTPTKGSREVISVVKETCDDDKWLALDVIGGFGLLTTAVAVDGLPMYVYAVDGEYIQPQTVDVLVVANGDRFSVLVHPTKPGDYPLRVASLAAPQVISANATIAYREEKSKGVIAPLPSTTVKPPAFIDDAGRPTSTNVVFFNQDAQRPFSPPEPFFAGPADQTFKLSLRIAGRSFDWALNETQFPGPAQADTPTSPVVLFKPDANRHDNLTMSTRNNTWVDLVFLSTTVPMPPHPIHKHGNKMWLLGQGSGPFKWATVAEAAKAIPQSFNLVNPPRRDSFVTPPANTDVAWMAVRYHVTNPGAWLVHCHIQSHLIGGMAMVIQDGVDKFPRVPAEYLNYH
ncbi:Cupredoxin [Lasiosphaeria ovina]|uniref:Cupredoxin n=1 Tax=Lasiosphaeria ovina TaxID=92902 RepID=A0AAE0JWF2_9PEZI|nr:Cupredoxin [Lasiosphaeria ovina]